MGRIVWGLKVQKIFSSSRGGTNTLFFANQNEYHVFRIFFWSKERIYKKFYLKINIWLVHEGVPNCHFLSKLANFDKIGNLRPPWTSQILIFINNLFDIRSLQQKNILKNWYSLKSRICSPPPYSRHLGEVIAMLTVNYLKFSVGPQLLVKQSLTTRNI